MEGGAWVMEWGQGEWKESKCSSGNRHAQMQEGHQEPNSTTQGHAH
jgi:hypothetical protein